MPKAFVLACLIFSGCQTTGHNPTRPVVPSSSGLEWLRSQSHFSVAQAELAALDRWRLNAKVAVTTPQLKESANLIWAYQDQSNQLKMFGPLGAGAIRLDFDQYGVQLSDGKGVMHRGENAEDLLQTIVGWPIPVHALSYWLFSLPHPDFSYEYQLNDDGKLLELRQLGWRVSYSTYSGHSLPAWGGQMARKISAVRQSANQAPVTVKLVAKSWQP